MIEVSNLVVAVFSLVVAIISAILGLIAALYRDELRHLLEPTVTRVRQLRTDGAHLGRLAFAWGSLAIVVIVLCAIAWLPLPGESPSVARNAMPSLPVPPIDPPTASTRQVPTIAKDTDELPSNLQPDEKSMPSAAIADEVPSNEANSAEPREENADELAPSVPAPPRIAQESDQPAAIVEFEPPAEEAFELVPVDVSISADKFITFRLGDRILRGSLGGSTSRNLRSSNWGSGFGLAEVNNDYVSDLIVKTRHEGHEGIARPIEQNGHCYYLPPPSTSAAAPTEFSLWQKVPVRLSSARGIRRPQP